MKVIFKADFSNFWKILGISLWLISCQTPPQDSGNEEGLPVFFKISNERSDIHLPFLFVHQGEMNISWVESEEGNAKFQYANIERIPVDNPTLIASGDNWFINWADYPQVAAFENGNLMAVFLQKSSAKTFSYDVMYTIFNAQKGEWTLPIQIHDDKTYTEHGFVSMSPWGDNMLISWLDGRNTDGSHHQDSKEAMTIRAAVFDNEGRKINEWLLDDRVCDCCQTGSAISELGPIIIFRDRSEWEVRDIGVIRWNEDSWTDTKLIHLDLWEIAACPVNGPRISALQNNIAVAWFTGTNQQSAAKVTFSNDNGGSFGTPVRFDLGNTIGRVAIELLDSHTAFVLWIEDKELLGRKVKSNGQKGKPLLIAKFSEKRSSGFPQMKMLGNELWFAWTDDAVERKEIKIARIDINEIN